MSKEGHRPFTAKGWALPGMDSFGPIPSPEMMRNLLKGPVLWVTVAMGLALGVMLYLRIKLLSFHVLNMGGVDQNIVQGTVRLLLGEPLYGDPTAPPFPIIQYAPLFFHLHAWLCTMLGLGMERLQDIYVAGRVLCLVLNLATMALVVRTARALGLRGTLPLLAGAFLITALTEMYFLRPDALYLFFFWAHVLLFLRVVREGPQASALNLALSALMAVLAVFSKQSGVVIPLMAGVWFLCERRWRDLFHFAAYCAVFAVLGLVWLLGGNEPWAAYANVVLGNANGTDVRHMLSHLTSKYGHMILAWLLLGTVLSVAALRRSQDPMRRYLALGGLVALAWAMLTALKRGSNANYYNEAQMIFVLLGLCMLQERPWAGAPRFAPFVLGLMAVVSLARTGMYFSSVEITHYRRDEPEPYARDMRIAERIRAQGLDAQDHVFLLGRGYTEMLLAPHTLLNAKDIVHVSAEGFRLDLSEFRRMLGEGEVRYIIAPADVDAGALTYDGIALTGYAPLFTEQDITVFERRR